MMSCFAREEERGACLERAAHQTHAGARAHRHHFMALTVAARNKRCLESACWEMTAQALRDLGCRLRFTEVHGAPLTLIGVRLGSQGVHFDCGRFIWMRRTRRFECCGKRPSPTHHFESRLRDAFEPSAATDPRPRRCTAEEGAFHHRAGRALRVRTDAPSARHRHRAADAFHSIARGEDDDLERLVPRQGSARLKWADQPIADALDQPIIDAAGDRIERCVRGKDRHPLEQQRRDRPCGGILPNNSLDRIEDGGVIGDDRVHPQIERFCGNLVGQVDGQQDALAAGFRVPREESDIVPFGGKRRRCDLRECAGEVSDAASLPWHVCTVPAVGISCILKVKSPCGNLDSSSMVHGTQAGSVPEQSKRSEDSSSGAAQVRKHFVLDTNVLLHNPQSLFKFEEHEVVIPLAVLEELDTFKKNNDEKGRNARQVIRSLDRLRGMGHLFDGVVWNDQGGSVKVVRLKPAESFDLDLAIADNRIIAVAHALNAAGLRTIFVSKDINARVKCDAIGVTAEDFEADRVDADWLDTGFVVSRVPRDLIDDLYSERQLPISRLEAVPMAIPVVEGEPQGILPNHFVSLIDEGDPSHTGLARRLGDTGHLIPVTGPRKPIYGVIARNVQQTMALDLLLDDDVKLVTLIGPAGTGKTLMAIAAGMHKVFKEERFDKLLVARPIMPLGRDIGYLPGDKDEKLSMWMQPIFDNISYLLSTRGGHTSSEPDSKSTEQRIDQLVASRKLVLEPITYIRGRSIPHQFIIVDEAQNLSPHEVKTIVSRVGDGTKIVLCGDIRQIDNPYLDASSNGLSHLIERMKGHRIAGHVTLSKTERSELASIAAEML